jgi:hypothetical protein
MFVNLFRFSDIHRCVYIFKLNYDSLVSIQPSYRDQDTSKITTEQILDCSSMLQEEVLRDWTTLVCGYCLPTSPQESKGLLVGTWVSFLEMWMD